MIPDTFWGTVYETANYLVEHFYKTKPTDLKAIEERSPENVMESSLGMNLTVSTYSGHFLHLIFLECV